MLSMRRKTHAALGVVLAAGTVTGSASAQVVEAPDPLGMAYPVGPVNVVLLHNEQGGLSMAPFWIGAGGCTTRDYTLFHGVGALTGGDGQSWVSGVSPDGRVVVGASYGSAGPGAPPAWLGFAWASCGGIRPTVGPEIATFGSEARAASMGGAVIVGVGSNGPMVGCRWFSGDLVGLDIVRDLRDGAPMQTLTTGVSADGTVVVGSAFDSTSCQAFVLIQGAPGAMALGDLPGGPAWSEATGISSDGSAVVGLSRSGAGIEAFRWTFAGGMVGLGDLAGGGVHSEAAAASVTGSVIVGWGTTLAGVEAFRWTPTGGMMSLGDLPGGGTFSQATAVSGDGAVIVGTSTGFHGDEAFIWDTVYGMRSLRSVLITEHGLDLSQWTLVSATGISLDGRTIVGNGYNPDGLAEGWVVQLPDRCPGDWDDNGVVDSSDFFAFLSGFFGSSADFNHDGVTNSQDFFGFLTAFFGGC